MYSIIFKGSTASELLPDDESQNTKTNSAAVRPKVHAGNTQYLFQQSSLSNPFIISDQVTRSELIWVMRCVESNKSKNSVGADTLLFPLMFPDSEVAQKFQLGRTKLSYMISYGLVPYFRDILDKQLTSCDNFRISFDEAFNDVSQKKTNGYHRKILRQKQERNRYPLLQLVFSWTDYS